MSKWKVWLGIFFIFIVIGSFTLWLGWGDSQRDDQQGSPPGPGVKLSYLSRELEESLQDLRRRAEQQARTRGDQFSLELPSLTGDSQLGHRTPLVLQLDYGKERVVEMPGEFVGLTLTQIESFLGDWEVVDYRPERALILSKQVEENPSTAVGGFKLGIRGGKIAIISRESGLEEVLELEVSALPEAEREMLIQGIEVSSREEMLSILEGLISFYQD